jgi:3-phenylpropionate/trans-cinnamate dioxygenase ferredoxin reductase component
MNTQPSFVIVGGGMAGALAAQTLREEGFDGMITLLGQEPNAPYERPPLSKDYLQGKADRDSIFVQPAPWYAEHAVELSLNSAVTSVEPASRTVTTAAGERLSYDKLLLATGSKPRRLDLPGADLDGVYYLRNVEDSERIKIEFGRAKRVVIIGAGWIGLETAAVPVPRGWRSRSSCPATCRCSMSSVPRLRRPLTSYTAAMVSTCATGPQRSK